MNLSEEEIIFLKQNYPNDKCGKFCAEFLKKKPSTIKYYCNQLGIKSNYYRKLIPIEKFSNISTANISYVLGILWADGSLSKTHNSVSMEISLADFEEIETVFDSIGVWSKYSRPQRKNDSQTKTISFCQKDLYNLFIENDYLIKSGASADKILSKIPENLKHYWWRGYFDGDGCISNLDKGYQIKITSCHHQDWIFVQKQFNDLDIKYFKINRSEYTPIGNIKLQKYSNIVLSSYPEIFKFLNYIYQNYENDKIGFTRKYHQFLEYKDRWIKSYKRSAYKNMPDSIKLYNNSLVIGENNVVETLHHFIN